ncbi:MAG TPA: hypothetical protein VF980_16430 [Thermoanaerobaculia bacterium]
MRRHLLVFAVAAVCAVPVVGQDRSVWRTAADVREGASGSIVGTAVDVDEAKNQVTIAADDDRYGRITVVTDSVSTQYNGFGDVINGKPEIFIGSKGFSNIRSGDRLEIRGLGRAYGEVRADYITLLGRSVAAPQTGVGETRAPGRVSTPTVGSTTTVYGRIEGVVRSVDAADNMITVETDRREIFNIRTTSNTPVTYHGDSYRVSNLEPGDRIRVDSDGGTTSDREIRARSIDVVTSVQDSGATAARSVSTLSGRVTRIDRTADVIRVDTGRGEVRVDMSRAYDPTGRRVRAADVQVGDRVGITGGYGSSADVFSASTVRFNEDVFAGDTGGAGTVGPGTTGAGQGPDYGTELVVVTIQGTVTDTLQNATAISIRERGTGRIISLYATDDFPVRTRSGSYTTADHVNVNDSVIVKAYRDAEGNYIAQTIRVR